MSGLKEISFSRDTWTHWKRAAVTARERARTTAWIAFGVVTLAVVLAGLAFGEGVWRYSVIIYAPLVAWIVFEPTTRAVMRREFQTTGAAMRYRLVPALVPRASDAELAELAARDVVPLGAWVLRAVDTGKEVVVSAGRSSTALTDDGVVVVDLDDGGSAGWTDGGGFVGGGGDGGGGGGG